MIAPIAEFSRRALPDHATEVRLADRGDHTWTSHGVRCGLGLNPDGSWGAWAGLGAALRSANEHRARVADAVADAERLADEIRAGAGTAR